MAAEEHPIRFPGDLGCEEHGWLTHVFIHEAGHAVAAVDRRIPFKSVTIFSADEWFGRHSRAGMLGGLELTIDDPREWVPSMPTAALEMTSAGSLSEEVILGHYLERGFEGDLGIWRAGMGATGSLTPDMFDKLVGEPLGAVVKRVRQSVHDNHRRIWTLVHALAGIEPTEGESYRHLDLSRSHSLSETDVVELVGREP